ncbi:MAG TPA: hypothetical protein VN327_17790 [Pseudonocardiaceae bacterium]|nr:hypothetical protein [Pseudonocardiaceae bacterium]
MISRRIKITLLTGAAALAIAGVGTGVTLAQSSDPPSPTAVALSSAVPAPHGMCHVHNGHNGHGRHGRHGGLLARIEHGEATVTTNHGSQVVDFQRGVVDSANSGQLTVRSADGFTATYVVNNSTKINKDRKTSKISQVVAKDRVTVLATKAGSTATATRIHDTGTAG